MSVLSANEVLTLRKHHCEVSIDYTSLRKAVLVLRALEHPLRKQIILMLDREKEMIVTEIYRQLQVEQSVVSQHLAILRRAGILQTKRKGKFIYYSIYLKRIADIHTFVHHITSLS